MKIFHKNYCNKYGNKYSALAALVLLLSQPCLAEQNNNLVVTGLQLASKSTYAFATAIVPFSDAKLGQGWYQKAGLSWMRYRYDGTLNGNSSEVIATAPGVEAGMGHMWNTEKSGLDLSATVGYRNIGISPFVPAGDRDGNVFTLNPQVQARHQLSTTTDADLLANYAIGMHSSFVRTRLGWKPVAGWRTGVEGIWQDGKNYHVTQQGLFLMKTLASGMTLEINAGQAKPENESAKTYIGFTVSSTY